MGLHRKLDGLLRGAQAAHATYSVYGSDPRALGNSAPEKQLTQQHVRIARIPYGDTCPGGYGNPQATDELPRKINNQLAQLGPAALDAGNGDILDPMIDAAIAKAHFEVECEHSLRVSAIELLIMRNRGDAAAVELQLADAKLQLEQAELRNAWYQELFARAEQPRLRRKRKNRDFEKEVSGSVWT